MLRRGIRAANVLRPKPKIFAAGRAGAARHRRRYRSPSGTVRTCRPRRLEQIPIVLTHSLREHVPMRSTKFVGWAKAGKTSPHRHGARSAVPTRTDLTSCTFGNARPRGHGGPGAVHPIE